MNYFIIPGNPPAVHFYDLWKKEIIVLQSDARVKVSAYPMLEPNQNSTMAMQRVSEVHSSQFYQFYEEVNSPVTLIGHSLGAYFAMEILKSNPERVRNAVLIHPFLRAPNFRGRVTLKTVGAFYNFKCAQRAFLKARKLFESVNSELIHVTNDEILKAFQLARHESNIIARDTTPITIDENLRGKVKVFYVADDAWCMPATIASLGPQVATHECIEPHGFVTEKEHRLNLFRQIMGVSKAAEWKNG